MVVGFTRRECLPKFLYVLMNYLNRTRDAHARARARVQVANPWLLGFLFKSGFFPCKYAFNFTSCTVLALAARASRMKGPPEQRRFT